MSSPEVLTVEQFAEKMMVSRTTVFGWLKSGVLKEGIHYIRLGRILRFCWREGLFFQGQQKPHPEDEGHAAPPPVPRSEHDSQRGAASVPGPGLTFGRGAAPAMNLDY
ncbi:helix-turn-helix domain-containing protein [Geomonas sp. Red69]|uniref:helix-turn-helix domain-containing protein n=1 Tax=Geomonas diazotrophica TaxID=2843197 RepID=UPI001C1158C4|nr:helix-turn-helix domain-containing protein [Geomonas diazotrophica]MBU5639097.1 helix-turn-helix domain-containing protein [Geomonas diazotrophica]